MLCFGLWGPIFASEFDQLLFLNAESIRPESIEPQMAAAVEVKKVRFQKQCPEGPQRLCVRWKMHLMPSQSEAALRAAIEAAMSVWASVQSFDIDFVYYGRFETWPETLGDAFEADLIISFEEQASDFLEYEISKQTKQVFYDSNQEILDLDFSIIRLNPARNPFKNCQDNCLKPNGFGSFSLRSAFVFEIGRFLGLGPSALSASVMFPVQRAEISKNYSQLHINDRASLRALYELDDPNSGRLQGHMIDGSSFEGWPGAHLILLPKAASESFASSRDQGLFKYSTLSKRDGSFDFQQVEAGDYVLLAESLNETSLIPEIFSDAVNFFSRRESFEPDFYEGKDRESNVESLRYSPRAIFFAATLHVLPGQQVVGVEIITNNLNQSANVRRAAGSSSESLSEIWPEEIDWLLSAASETRRGGCSLKLQEKLPPSPWAFFMIFAGLILLSRFHWLRNEQGRRAR